MALPRPGGTWHAVQETLACEEVFHSSPATLVALQLMQYVGVSVAHTGITRITATTATKPTTTRAATQGERYHARGLGRYLVLRSAKTDGPLRHLSLASSPPGAPLTPRPHGEPGHC